MNSTTQNVIQQLRSNIADVQMGFWTSKSLPQNFTLDANALQNPQQRWCQFCLLSRCSQRTFKASMTRSLASNSPSRMLKSVSSSGLLSFSRFILKTCKMEQSLPVFLRTLKSVFWAMTHNLHLTPAFLDCTLPRGRKRRIHKANIFSSTSNSSCRMSVFHLFPRAHEHTHTQMAQGPSWQYNIHQEAAKVNRRGKNTVI